MSDLKPCPFCGYEVIPPMEIGSHADPMYKWQVNCDGCEFIIARPTEEEAIKAWNTRAGEDE